MTTDGDCDRDPQSPLIRTGQPQGEVAHGKDAEQVTRWDLGGQGQHLSVPKIQKNQREAEADTVGEEGSSVAGRSGRSTEGGRAGGQLSSRVLAPCVEALGPIPLQR